MRGRLRTTAGDGGFTLVELLSVVVIIGILSAIALPNFLSKRQRAYDATLERALKDAATAQEAWLVEAGGYSSDLRSLSGEGWKSTKDVRVDVALVADGYCLRATRPGAARPLYMTNAGPAAGQPTPEACV